MGQTQMSQAINGVITPQMREVATKEFVDANTLRELIAQGKVVIPANVKHETLCPQGIGQGLRTKINVNIGVSNDCCNMELELQKAIAAQRLQAEAIMDLSCFGKTKEFRKRLLQQTSAIIGTVPIYDAVGYHDKDLADLKVADFLKVVEEHAKDGVDFMTIHAGLNRSTVERIKKNKRLTNIVSRGGSLLFAWMEVNNAENPFYEHFDELLAICHEYDVTLSLGDACRPGSINDATDSSQIEELIVLGELTKRAWQSQVQVMIEGPGHMPLNEIAANMILQKKLCHGAPFYVLGPLVTDVAPGYDHITSAIGGAIAASNGADFLCYVTPAEHLRLPTLEDMKEGIIAVRIAAHAADLVKGIPNAKQWDDKMSEARAKVDFAAMIDLAIDPDKARKYREENMPKQQETCTMCGKMCAMKTMNQILNNQPIDI